MDGQDLGCKNVASQKRSDKRDRYEKMYKDLENDDQMENEDACEMAVIKKYSSELTNEYIYIFLDFLEYKGVEFIVAPYEADSQLAYLYKIGYVDCIFTEDSDLVAYGCFDLIRRMKKDGHCKKLNVFKSFKTKNKSMRKIKHIEYLRNMKQSDLTKLCIFAGCDYMPNIKGLGLGNLFRIFKENKKGYKDVIREVMEYKGMDEEEIDEYFEKFDKVYSIFTQQLVYCPHNKEVVNLSFSDGKHKNTKKLDEAFIGSHHPKEKDFAKGKLELDNLNKKRKKTNIDFDRIIKFFQYQPDFSHGRIGNLTYDLVTYKNFDKECKNTVIESDSGNSLFEKRDFSKYKQDTGKNSAQKSYISGATTERNKKTKLN